MDPNERTAFKTHILALIRMLHKEICGMEIIWDYSSLGKTCRPQIVIIHYINNKTKTLDLTPCTTLEGCVSTLIRHAASDRSLPGYFVNGNKSII